MAQFELTQTGEQIQADLNKVETIVANPETTTATLSGLTIGTTSYTIKNSNFTFTYDSSTGTLAITDVEPE